MSFFGLQSFLEAAAISRLINTFAEMNGTCCWCHLLCKIELVFHPFSSKTCYCFKAIKVSSSVGETLIFAFVEPLLFYTFWHLLIGRFFTSCKFKLFIKNHFGNKMDRKTRTSQHLEWWCNESSKWKQWRLNKEWRRNHYWLLK